MISMPSREPQPDFQFLPDEYALRPALNPFGDLDCFMLDQARDGAWDSLNAIGSDSEIPYAFISLRFILCDRPEVYRGGSPEELFRSKVEAGAREDDGDPIRTIRRAGAPDYQAACDALWGPVTPEWAADAARRADDLLARAKARLAIGGATVVHEVSA